MYISDEELVQRHLAGDSAAFSNLMRSSISAIYNFVRPYVDSNDEAEDVVQDSFLKAWKNIKKFNRNKKWKPWIFAIARNTALDYLKKRKAVPFSGMDDPDDTTPFSDTIADTEPLATEIFEQSQDANRLASAISLLRKERSSVIMLHYHQELTFDEIAAILGAPMNTVKSWHRRALMQLKNSLNDAPKQV